MARESGAVDRDLYRLSIEQTQDYGLFLLDTAGHVMTWNAGAQRIQGYAPEEIIGKHFSIFYAHDSVQSGWPTHELKVATKEGHFEDEGWRLRKDGSRFWANVVITALRDEAGKLVAFSKITRDLSERKRSEEHLRTSEERFRLLVDGVVDYAIYLLDPDGIVTSWNAGAQRLKGYAPEEIIGKHFSRFYSPEDVEVGKPWEVLVTARRNGRSSEEGWRIKKSGERFWARVVVSALHDTDGRLRGFAKVTQDLSERRQLQDLEQTAKDIQKFIALLAHELRNPLQAIRFGIQVLTKSAWDSPQHGAMVQTIDRQSTQLTRIVDDLLDVSRISVGNFSIAKDSVDLGEVVRRAVETAAPLFDDGKHKVELGLPAGEVFVVGDIQRLTQLVANLLNNAARYTAEGGTISVTVRADARGAELAVRDSGCGIEPEMINRIFDPFIQGTQRPGMVRTGLGIGLALARKIAELHGGLLEAQSDGLGRGSEFTLRLPLADASVQSVVTAEPQDTKFARRRILVVDDNVDAATTLTLLLRSLGHETRMAHDGIQAISAALEFGPEAVLLDIAMPGIDGYEVARRLRALKQDAPLLIIAVTGYGQAADRQRSQEAGFDVHLVKPVEVHALAEALGERGAATLH